VRLLKNRDRSRIGNFDQGLEGIVVTAGAAGAAHHDEGRPKAAIW